MTDKKVEWVYPGTIERGHLRQRKDEGQRVLARNEYVAPDAQARVLIQEVVATAVPLLPIVAGYHHVRRVRHPLRGRGKWSSEQDAFPDQ